MSDTEQKKEKDENGNDTISRSSNEERKFTNHPIPVYARSTENEPKSYHKLKLNALDDYIQNKTEYEIYEELSNSKSNYFGVFDEPLLDFFHLLYKQIYMIERYKFRPLFIAENFKQLSINEEQFLFLGDKILNYFQDSRISDQKLDICCREISKVLDKKREIVNAKQGVLRGNTPDPKPLCSPGLPFYLPEIQTKKIEDKNLDDYLDSEFNLEIYQDLTVGKNKDVFDDPRKFFQFLDEQVKFVSKNISKPDTVIKTLRNLPLNERQKHLIYHYFIEILNKVDRGEPDAPIRICRELIKIEFNKLDKELFPQDSNENTPNDEKFFEYDFSLVKNHLQTLPDFKTQIVYLIEAKTDYEQADVPKNILIKPNFADKCQLEIDKLEQLSRIDFKPEQAEKIERIQPKSREKMNIERAFLFFHYLSQNPNATKIEEKKRKAIEMLTGYKIGQLNKVPAWFKEKKSLALEEREIDEKYFIDMKEVRKLFEMFGLADCIKLIDKDLGESDY